MRDYNNDKNDASLGFVLLHKKILENPLSKKPNYFAVFIYLLLKANYSDKEIIFNNKKITIPRGSFIGSIKKIATQFGVSTSTVSFILEYLVVEKIIEKCSTMKYTMFTVLNYDQYQNLKSELKTSRKLAETTKEEIKKNKEYPLSPNPSPQNPTLEQVVAENEEREFFLKNEGKEFFDYYSERGWLDSNGKPVLNWRQLMRLWAKEERNLDMISRELHYSRIAEQKQIEERQKWQKERKEIRDSWKK